MHQICDRHFEPGLHMTITNDNLSLYSWQFGVCVRHFLEGALRSFYQLHETLLSTTHYHAVVSYSSVVKVPIICDGWRDVNLCDRYTKYLNMGWLRVTLTRVSGWHFDTRVKMTSETNLWPSHEIVEGPLSSFSRHLFSNWYASCTLHQLHIYIRKSKFPRYFSEISHFRMKGGLV